MSVFSNSYEGDDFCSGLIFGSNGAQMLVNIAKTLINISQITRGSQGAIMSNNANKSIRGGANLLP